MSLRRITRARILAGPGIASPVIDSTFTFNPPDLPAAGTATAGTAVATALAGVALGDAVIVYPPYSMAGVLHSAYVDAAGTIAVALHNTTNASVNLASGSWGVQVFRRT